MKVGTRSILFGYHAFWLHPFMVAAAWWKLYGFPRQWQLWAAFFLHDSGYWGCSDMDGPEGSCHPELGAKFMGRFCRPEHDECWHDFCLYHSRDYARQDGATVSKLCVADKLAGCMYPDWLAVGLCRLSGELKEYMDRRGRSSAKEWMTEFRKETMKWIKANYNYNEASPDSTNRRPERGSVTDNGISSLRNS